MMHEFASILRAQPAGFKLEPAYYWSRPTSTVHGTGHVVEEDRQPFRDMALCGQRQGVAVRLRLTGRIARLLHIIVAMSATPFFVHSVTHFPPQGSHTSGLKCCTGTSALHSRWVQCNHTMSKFDGSSGKRGKESKAKCLATTTPPRQSHEGRSLTCLRKAVVSENIGPYHERRAFPT